MKTKLKILFAEFNRESYKFILNNSAEFTEKDAYPLIIEFNDLEFSYTILMMAKSLRA